jgi:hypothetical protein
MKHNYSATATASRRVNDDPLPSSANGLTAELKKSLENAQAQYLRTTEALLKKGQPKPAALLSHIAFLRKSRDSYSIQLKRIRNDKARKDSIDAVINSIDDAIARVSRHIVERLDAVDVKGGGAYAYGPREGIHYDVHTPGRDHFQLALPLVHGRLVRQMGDLMCKSSREFWGLRITTDPKRVTCWACIKGMVKLLEEREVSE